MAGAAHGSCRSWFDDATGLARATGGRDVVQAADEDRRFAVAVACRPAADDANGRELLTHELVYTIEQAGEREAGGQRLPIGSSQQRRA